jgi:hypothetical protein
VSARGRQAPFSACPRQRCAAVWARRAHALRRPGRHAGPPAGPCTRLAPSSQTMPRMPICFDLLNATSAPMRPTLRPARRRCRCADGPLAVVQLRLRCAGRGGGAPSSTTKPSLPRRPSVARATDAARPPVSGSLSRRPIGWRRFCCVSRGRRAIPARPAADHSISCSVGARHRRAA